MNIVPSSCVDERQRRQRGDPDGDNRIGFYARAAGLFCILGRGSVDFVAMTPALEEKGFAGLATVEQDCDPNGPTSPVEDGRANLDYLKSVGLTLIGTHQQSSCKRLLTC